MSLLEYIFQLGIVFAVFGFIWWLFTAGLTVLRGGPSQNIYEIYSLKLINYFFLVSVTARFCSEEYDGTPGNDGIGGNIIGGLILLIFLLGKIQNKEKRVNLMKAMGSMNSRFEPIYNKTIEIILLFVSMGMLLLFETIPTLMHNPITNWFVDSIENIIETPIFGFIFKVVGFFFMLRILLKFIGGLFQLIGLRPPVEVSSHTHFNDSSDKKEDDFDDYEEL